MEGKTRAPGAIFSSVARTAKECGGGTIRGCSLPLCGFHYYIDIAPPLSLIPPQLLLLVATARPYSLLTLLALALL